jgi:predicted outer membrane protein
MAVLFCLGTTTFASAAGDHDRPGDLNAQDRMFLVGSAEGAKFEVLAGQIAARHGSKASVKSFGRRMIRDHSLELNRILAEARDEHLSVPHQPSPELRRVLQLFSQFWGKDFDCFYMAYEYADHTADVGEAELELADGHDHSVKQLGAWVLHHIYEPHLALASDVLLSIEDCH